MDQDRLNELKLRADKATKVAAQIEILSKASHNDQTSMEWGLKFRLFELGKLELLAQLEKELEGLLNPLATVCKDSGPKKVQMVGDFPRRILVNQYTPAEEAIRYAKDAVEAAGAHPLLTDAVVLLEQAQEKVADFVELPAE